MNNFSMIASHCVGKNIEDTIFGISGEAGKATLKFGKENVINATIGAIMDDSETLSTLPTVDEIFKSIPPKAVAAYAPIEGLPDYLNSAVDLTFYDNKPDAYVGAVAAPGGSGAVSLTIANYSEVGDYVLTSDWYWDPYSTMCDEHNRKLATFKLFDEKGRFNLDDFEQKTSEILRKQDSLLIILNTPAHNPTGFSMNDFEWEKTVEIIKKVSTDKKITLLVDIAYIDYCGDKNEVRKFMKLFGGLPQNIFITIAFSISKSFLMYGLRTGAVVGISSDKNVAQEFKDMMRLACRGIWSNCNRSGMELVINILKDGNIDKIRSERLVLNRMIDERSQLFINEAKENNLKLCPFSAGFFISMPHENPRQVVDKLMQQNIFAVPLEKGVRFATCAIPKDKIIGLAAKVAKCI